MSCMLTAVLFLPWRRCGILVYSEDTHGNPAPALSHPVNFTSTVSHSPPGLLSHLPLFFDKKPSVSSSSPSCLSQSADTHSLSPQRCFPLFTLQTLCSCASSHSALRGSCVWLPPTPPHLQALSFLSHCVLLLFLRMFNVC